MAAPVAPAVLAPPVAGPRPLALPPTVRSDHFDLSPLTPVIGAEVRGIDLARPLHAGLQADLHAALLAWKVLVLRDQAVDGAGLCDVGRAWGELEVHPVHEQGDRPEVVRFDRTAGYENTWHSDVSWRPVPSLGSLLRCVVTPEVGGDTLWADMTAAWDGLDAPTRARVRGLTATHDITAHYDWGRTGDALAAFRAEHPPVHHPVVRTHPETGREILYVNESFTARLDDVDPGEGAALLAHLVAQARVPEYQCRVRWSPGTVVLWDNRSTQHYATSDYSPARRVMERVTVIGDRPT